MDEEIVRINLLMDSEEFDDFWNEWKDSIMSAIKKHKQLNHDFDWGYCLESDFQRDEDFFDEENIDLIPIANEDGLIIYKYVKRSENGHL